MASEMEVMTVTMTAVNVGALTNPFDGGATAPIVAMERGKPAFRVKRLNPHAQLPVRGSSDAAGFDLHACLRPAEAKTFEASSEAESDSGAGGAGGAVRGPKDEEAPTLLVRYGEVVCVPTGLAVAMRPGTYGRIAPRSGLAARDGIDTLAGVVDADYRGEVRVLLTCVKAGGERRIAHGERIAQLIPELFLSGPLEEVDNLSDLGGTARGAGGFGSTGTR